MAIYKRGKFYWYKFMWNGDLVRESTKQTNDKVARQLESEHRNRLAKEHQERTEALERLRCTSVGRCPECRGWFDSDHCSNDESGVKYCSNYCVSEWAKKHRVLPTLGQFCDRKMKPWARTTFEKTVLNT